MASISKNFIYRISVGLTLAFLSIFLILISKTEGLRWVFFIGYSSLVLLAQKELYQMMGKESLPQVGLLFSFLFLLGAFFSCSTFLLLSSFLFIPISFIPFFLGKPSPIAGMSQTIFPFVYLALPMAAGLMINNLEQGSLWLIFSITVAKMTDVGGYFGGKSFGRRPLAKTISPNKTIEGAFCGVVCSVITALLFPFISPQFSFISCGVLGLGISFLSEFGDLSESLIKRTANVKDSGSLPGMGGVLDVLDSLVFALPMMYMYLKESIS